MILNNQLNALYVTWEAVMICGFFGTLIGLLWGFRTVNNAVNKESEPHKHKWRLTLLITAQTFIGGVVGMFIALLFSMKAWEITNL